MAKNHSQITFLLSFGARSHRCLPQNYIPRYSMQDIFQSHRNIIIYAIDDRWGHVSRPIISPYYYKKMKYTNTFDLNFDPEDCLYRKNVSIKDK